MTFIYILELTYNKFYVGKTDKSVEERFEEHLNGVGSQWTKMYKPIKIIETISNADPYDEDKYTKIYMDKYGIDNVRGGSYVSKNLSDFQYEALKTELCTSKNKCFKCLRTGHFSNKCYAKTDINGNIISNKEFDTKKQTTFYEKKCKTNKNNLLNNECYRCGRYGHWADNCYANTDINGKKINKTECFLM